MPPEEIVMLDLVLLVLVLLMLMVNILQLTFYLLLLLSSSSLGKHIQKVCFIIFYKSAAIEKKIHRICDAFGANRYDLSNLSRPHELDSLQQENHREMFEAKQVLDKNNETRMRLCIELAHNVEEWLWIVRREKSTYHTLNLFKSDVAGNSVLRGRGWLLTEAIPTARSAIKRAHINMNLAPTALLEKVYGEQWPTPPTHFITNKYTVAFQSFVNTYGVPRYKEINPALFTAATFPFLFGVMYGDIGHGSCIMLAGLYLIITESLAEARSTSGMLKDIYVARYMLFAMGLMGIYAGLIYNDYFSLGLDIFGSRWFYNDRESGAKAQLDGTYGDASKVYPFGVDPAWKISDNELLFYNSMKMKLSVIIGITQMSFGILLRGINCYFFKNSLDLITEFAPMMIFNISLFGYMVVLIFVKWTINWDQRMALGSCAYNEQGTLGGCTLGTSSSSCYTSTGDVCDANTQLVDMCPLNYGGTGDGCQPPNLITTLINIALKPGNVEEPMYQTQASVQTFLLLVAFICVPWLLLVKPIYLWHTHNKEGPHDPCQNPLLGSNHGSNESSDEMYLHSRSNDSSDEQQQHYSHDQGHGHGEEFNFGEIFIHQTIETIEFVLGKTIVMSFIIYISYFNYL